MLKENPQLLKQLWDVDYQHDNLEKPVQDGYMDMNGLDQQSGLPVMIESQLNQSDDNHFKKVKRLIDETNEGIIAWFAPSFRTEHISALSKLVHFQTIKPIKLYFVELNDSFLDELTHLNQLTDMAFWERLSAGLVVLPELSVVGCASTMPDHYQARDDHSIWVPDNPTISTYYKNQYFMRRLSKRMPYFLNVHRYKKLKSNQLNFGTGRTSIRLAFSLVNRMEQPYIEFSITNPKQYEKAMFEQVLNDVASQRLKQTNWSVDHRILMYYTFSDDFSSIVEELIDQFEWLYSIYEPILNHQESQPIIKEEQVSLF